MIQALKVLGPDIVYLNGFDVFCYLLALSASKLKIPYVFQHAGILNVEVDLYKHLYSKAGVSFFKKMEIEATNMASYNIFLTDFSKNYFLKNVSKIKTRTATVGLPINFEYQEKKRGKKNRLSVGIVARWDRIKNYKKILDLARFCVKNKERIDFYAVTKIPDTGRYLNFKNSFKKHIEIVSPMNKTALGKFYKKMDVTLLPSHFDVSPFVVVESIMHGTPCIVSHNVGLKEIFSGADKRDYVDDFSDNASLVQKMKKASSRGIPLSIRKHIRENFNEVLIMKKHQEIFRQIIKNRK
jgi:glycosyltransferase involved in cell wall biosynthesis